MGAEAEIDELRKPWENDSMWEMRRKFLLRHWTDKSMTRNRLLCLAQTLINIECLGCVYDENLTTQVKSMADGLSAEFYERRHEEIKKGFGETKQDKSKVPSKRTKTDGSEAPKPAKSKKKESADTTVIVTTTDAECAAKLKIVQAIKAELFILQQQKNILTDGLATLNQACSRVKSRWQIRYDDKKHMCYLEIDDVLAVEHAYWGNQMKSRAEACDHTLALLQRPFFDVRRQTEKVNGKERQGEGMSLYTRRDLRSDWEDPAAGRFTVLEKALTTLRKRLTALPGTEITKNAQKALLDAANYCQLPVDVERVHSGGWREKITISVGKVRIVSQENQMTMKNKGDDALEELYQKTVDCLLKNSEPWQLAEENGLVLLGKHSQGAKKQSATPNSSNTEADDGISERELVMKRIRMQLDGTDEQSRPQQRLEEAATACGAKLNIKIDSDKTQMVTISINDVIISRVSMIDGKSGPAKLEACAAGCAALLQPQISITKSDNGQFRLQSIS